MKMTIELFKANNIYSTKIIDDNDKSTSEWNRMEVQLTNMSYPTTRFIKLKDLNTDTNIGYHALRIFGSTKAYYSENNGT